MTTVYTPEQEKLNQLYSRLSPRQRQILLQQAENYAATVDRLIAKLLPVKIEEGGEGYVVSDNVVEMYGTGSTVEEAMTDYKTALLDCYESLIEVEDGLSDALQKRLDLLKRIFEPEEQT